VTRRLLSFLLLLFAVLMAPAVDSTADVSPSQVFPKSWSPDGRYIIVAGGHGEYEVHPDGLGARRVPGGGYGYAWSSNGRFLAFGAKGNDVLGAGGGIFVESASGGRVRQLTHQTLAGGRGYWDGLPQWSPDGRWIAFTRAYERRAGAHSEVESLRRIWLVRPDGTGLHQLSRQPLSEFDASWSPDGKELLVQKGVEGGRDDLYIADVATGRERQLTYSEDNWGAHWSPRGDVIMFERIHHLNDSASDIWAIRPDGRGLRKITIGSTLGDGPLWAPNGKLIAFQSDSRRTNDCGEGPLTEIWLMLPDGSGQRPLFPHYTCREAPNDQAPVWSPDSKRIAFGRADLRYDIRVYIADIHGSHLRHLIG
jgi:Tol biopolymer transport system component